LFYINIKYINIPKVFSNNYSSINNINDNDNNNNRNNYNKDNINPEKKYNSLSNDRVNILKELKDKSGIYYLINNINGNTYVGSSSNLSNRMRSYLNNNFLKSKNNFNMPITKAMLKYNQVNFSL
jgi:hypothetical protein